MVESHAVSCTTGSLRHIQDKPQTYLWLHSQFEPNNYFVWTACEEMLWLFTQPLYYIEVFQSTQSMNFERVAMKYKTFSVNNFFSIAPKTHTGTMD